MEKIFECSLLQKFRGNVFIAYRTEHEEIIYTYDSVLDEVNKVLQQIGEYNISPNTGIALLLKSITPSGIVVLLSILNSNCYFVPCDYKSANFNSDDFLNAHGVKYVISDKTIDISKSYKLLGCLKAFESHLVLHVNLEMLDEIYEGVQNLCYSISTSGSTGPPKVVQVPYTCIKPNIDALSAQLKLTAEDLIYMCAPPTFDPFVVDFFLALNTGASLLISSLDLRLNPNKLAYILWPKSQSQSHKKGTTILQCTPSFLKLFGDSIIKDVILHESSTLRCLMLGGEDFPLHREWNNWLPTLSLRKRIFNIYGITELSCWCTIHECNFNENWDKAPLGRVLDNHTLLRITDKYGMELSGVCEGELIVGSAIRRCHIPSIDGQVRDDGNKICYRTTGDLVSCDEKGDIFFSGRIGSIVKRMGVRLSLETLQKRIQFILGDDCKNVKCLWQEEQQKLFCFVQINMDITYSRAHIRRCLMENLSEVERPDNIELISGFPLNSHGKLDFRCLLSKMCEKKPTDPEEIFTDFVTKTLGIDLFNTSNTMKKNSESTMSFIAVGGTSFQAITLVTEIGLSLDNACDKNELLQMLLSPHKSLACIRNFLATRSLSKYEFMTRASCEEPKSHKKNFFKFLWRTSLNKCVDSTPITIGNKWVCVGSHSHNLATIDSEKGALIALLELPDRIECKVEVITNAHYPYLAVVGCYNQHLYAFNFINGFIYWSKNLDGLIKAKPLNCTSGIVICTYSEEFNVVCISSKTQNYIWRKKIGTKGIYANPVAINNAALIVCTLDGSYCCILQDSGKYLWLRKCESAIFSTPVVIKNDTVILAEVAGKIHICNARNGELINTFCAGALIFCGLTTMPDIKNNSEQNLVFFGCYDKHVYCLKNYNTVDKGNQSSKLELVWKTQLDSNIFASPITITLQNSKYLLCCSTKGLLALLYVENGKIAAKHELNAEIFATPCNLNNQIFIGCRDNYVHSFSIHQFENNGTVM
ncbi:unnamed protein product [Ceratitis capitata]|uniref:(Mediterranean fruit fly) hypothetical protein n=1 Tax=Ceratitis capitata TaxID=7213 RepID=W8CAZ1_CERCA|nr:unnamed protein product [Ceratitis capitata]